MSQPDHSSALIARGLIRNSRTAVLSTLHRQDTDGAASAGWPYGSLVLVGCASDGAPILLLSDLAQHTKNIRADNRISLLYDASAARADPLAGERATLLGRVEPALPQDAEQYLARHPDAQAYAQFRDFAFFRVVPERCHLVAGFGKIAWIAQSELLQPTSDSRPTAPR